ncbi:barstar family protein [Micromonospora sp. RL09-050-HVF-A]|uniref:barstar family protein n=1 Tax=Micromonospora sp. RL09-050-HVF-A TaxID=1703433 RepID=UPI0027E22762|nr:barstar family protein [Micromonospora sp. RL09-050-HVF-A]
MVEKHGDQGADRMTDKERCRCTDPLVVCSPGSLVELAAVLPASGRFVVACLDGARMTNADQVFYDFSDALLFPSYFGWNWNALSDCLRDLHWLPADGYLVIVENAHRLLPNSTQDQHILLRVLARTVDHWANPLGQPDGKVVPFKVLLLCSCDEEAVHLRQTITRAVHNEQ